MELADVTIRIKIKAILDNLTILELEEMFQYFEDMKLEYNPYKVDLYKRFKELCENFINND